MRLPHAPLSGIAARMWALSEQGIQVTLQTASQRHFKMEVSYPNPNVPHGGGGRVWGDDPDDLLNQVEATLKDRGVQFIPSREYLAPILQT